jgi:hypothetical protein
MADVHGERGNFLLWPRTTTIAALPIKRSLIDGKWVAPDGKIHRWSGRREMIECRVGFTGNEK